MFYATWFLQEYLESDISSWISLTCKIELISIIVTFLRIKIENKQFFVI